MRSCEECKHYENGLSALDSSGVCLKRTNWADHELWWVWYWDRECTLFEEKRDDDCYR